MSELIYPQHCKESFVKKPSRQNGSNLKPNRVFKNEPLDDGRWMPHGQPHGNAKVAQKVLAIKQKKQIKEG